MAGEIKYNVSLSLSNGSLTDSYNMSGLTADQTTALLVRGVQTVPTTAAGTLLNMGGVSDMGYAVFGNLDVTNYVEVGLQISIMGSPIFFPFIKLLAGEKAMVCLGLTDNIWARANTLAVNLFYIIYER